MEPYSGAILIPTSGGGRGDGACVAAVGLEVKEGAKAEDIPNLGRLLPSRTEPRFSPQHCIARMELACNGSTCEV